MMVKAATTVLILFKIISILNSYLLEKYFWKRFAKQILSNSVFDKEEIPKKVVNDKVLYL